MSSPYSRPDNAPTSPAPLSDAARADADRLAGRNGPPPMPERLTFDRTAGRPGTPPASRSFPKFLANLFGFGR